MRAAVLVLAVLGGSRQTQNTLRCLLRGGMRGSAPRPAKGNDSPWNPRFCLLLAFDNAEHFLDVGQLGDVVDLDPLDVAFLINQDVGAAGDAHVLQENA